MFEFRGLPLVASIAAAILLASPLWFVTAPGMPDYPAHLASFALIGGTPSSYFSVSWQALPNLAAFAVALTLLYFSHLFALAVLLLAIGCYELSGWFAEKPRDTQKLAGRLWPVALICLPAAFAFLVLKPSGAGGTILEFDLL